MGISRDSGRLVSLLNELYPQDVILLADYDLTLAGKPDVRFHHAAITDQQYGVLSDVSTKLAATIVVTARGEDSTLTGLFGQRDRLPICVASNSGHHVLLNAEDSMAERFLIPLQGVSDTDAKEATRVIYTILADVGREFSANVAEGNVSYQEIPINGHATLILDPREICGAVVFEGVSADDAGVLRKAFSAAMEKIPGNLAGSIITADKYMMTPSGATNGYIDLKPPGMDKGISALSILSHSGFSGKITERTHMLVAGDSKPDIAMAEALTRIYGQDRVHFVWVGDDPAIYKHGGDELDVTVLEGNQHIAIPNMYEILKVAASVPGDGPRL